MQPATKAKTKAPYSIHLGSDEIKVSARFMFFIEAFAGAVVVQRSQIITM